MKSSHCSSTPGKSSRRASTNSSMSSKYSSPASRGCRQPMYRPSASRSGLSVPTSRLTGQGLGRVDAGGSAVDRQLADRDRHPARPLIADAEDRLVVGRHHQPYAVVGGRSKHLADPAAVLGSDPDPAATAKDVAELLRRLPHGRGVDDRQHLLEMVEQQPVEEVLVAVLQRRQSDVALQRVDLARELGVDALGLLVLRADDRRQQALEPEGATLPGGEGGALVEERLAKDLDAARAGLQPLATVGRRGPPPGLHWTDYGPKAEPALRSGR